MLNTLCRIWHGVFFGLLNSAQHYVKTPQWLLDKKEKGGGEKGGERFGEERREKGGSRKEKWRTSSQMRIGMDLEIDES